MSIDGATHLEEVDRKAWEKLADDVGFAPRFLAQRTLPFVEEVVETAVRLAAEREYGEEIVEEIVRAIQERAKWFRA
jgi:hypothetical protein